MQKEAVGRTHTRLKWLVVAILTLSQTGCIEEPLGIVYRLGETIYIEAPCGGRISALDVNGDDRVVVTFAATGGVEPAENIGLTAETDGVSISGDLVGELTASFEMTEGGWNSVVFDPQALDDGHATTGQVNGTLSDVREYIRDKCW